MEHWKDWFSAKKVKGHFHEILVTKSSSQSIALGFAVGTFIEIIPTPGFNILIGMAIVFLFKEVNKYALFAAMALWNAVLLVPIYIASKKIGDMIFGASDVRGVEVEFWDQALDFTRRFLVGNLILATILSIISYFLVKYLAEQYREKKLGLTPREDIE